MTLRAWYTPSTNGAAVVLLPGSGGAKDSTIAHAEVLAEHGYGVLALDSRGAGESGGTGNVWGWHGVADIAAATSWLSRLPDVDADRIAAVGLSMGGEEAITAAGAGVPLGAVVAEGVSARAPGDLEYLPTDPAGVTQRVMAQIMWGAADLLTAASPPVRLRDALAQADDVPVLIIAGSEVDEALAAPLLARASLSVDLWSLEDTAHIQSLSQHPDEWEARVTEFLESSFGMMRSARMGTDQVPRQVRISRVEGGGWALGPWLLAPLLFAHAWVHLVFLFPQPNPAASAGGLAYPFDMDQSWLITGVGLDAGLVRLVGIAVMAVVFIASVLAALATVGLLEPTAWWAGLVVASAVTSMLLLTLFFSPALLLGYAIDIALLWLVLGSMWSPTAMSA